MNRSRWVFVLVGLVLMTGVIEIESHAQSKVLSLTAVGKDEHPIQTLTSNDLRLKIDGKLFSVNDVAPAPVEPVDLVIMVDVSISQGRILPATKRLAHSLAENLLTATSNRLAVVAFSNPDKILLGLSKDKRSVLNAVEGIQLEAPPGYVPGSGTIVGQPPDADLPPQSRTTIWDSVVHVCSSVFDLPPTTARRVILLITDGEDTASKAEVGLAIETAIKQGVVVFAIGMGDRELFGVSTSGLRKLSEQSGGRLYVPNRDAILEEMVRMISANVGPGIRIKYEGDWTALKGKANYHEIRLEIANPRSAKQDIKLLYPRRIY